MSGTYQSVVPTLFFTLFLVLICPAEAKFSHIYQGIARQGLEACLADPKYAFTPSSITLRTNARDGFNCIMDSIPNSQQTILSSGASIIALIPTTLSLLGNTRSEIMAIHSKLPILAFLLTLTGVSVDGRIRGVDEEQKSEPRSRTTKTSEMFFDARKVELKSARVGLLTVHVFAAITAGAIIWQTYDLSQRAILSWGAWTSFYPLLWLFSGPVNHTAEVTIDLLDEHSSHTIKRTLKFLAGLLTKFQFLAGTAIMASLTLISGQNAVKVLAVYGIAAIVMRECAAWTLVVLSLDTKS